MLKYIGVQNERLLKALVSIQQYPEWKIIRDWIDESMEDLLITSAREISDVETRWKQGGAIELLKIREKFDKAKEAIERINNQK